MRRTPLGLLLLVAASTSCTDPAAPDDIGPPGLRVVSGAGVTDTIGTYLRRALIVEVRDANGRPARGAQVRFAATGDPGAAQVSVGRVTEFRTSNILVGTTDAAGRIAVMVQLGLVAGVASLAVTAPEPGLQTTAEFTIAPGAPASLDVQPADTAIHVDGTIALRGVVRDRGGNVLPTPVTFAVPSGGDVLSLSGSTARGARIGRGLLVATGGVLVDTARASVVPRGVIAALRTSSIGGRPHIVTMELDGSAMRTLVEPLDGASVSHPRWSPDGASVTFVEHARLWVADTLGTRRLLHSGTPAVSSDYAPEHSPDGAWIYVTQTDASTGIWRVRPDGSAVEKTPALWPQARAPSPSPAGDRLVYTNIDPELLILDLSSGVSTRLPVYGIFPRWSPTGEWIAHLDRSGRLFVMRQDGSDRRVIAGPAAPNGVFAQGNYSWSPDGQWIIYASNRVTEAGFLGVGLTLAHVESGLLLPLTFGTTQLIQPSWRR